MKSLCQYEDLGSALKLHKLPVIPTKNIAIRIQ